MPHFTAEVLREMFLKRLEQQRDAVARFFFVGFVVDPLAEALLQAAGIEGEKELLSSDIDHLVAVCKAFPFEMQGIADERTCQVRRWGSTARRSGLFYFRGQFLSRIFCAR